MANIALVSCGHELYRRYLLEVLAREHQVTLLAEEDAEWVRPFVRRTLVTDLHSSSAIVEALGGQSDTDGILCWDERFIVPAAQAADSLGLPSPTLAAVRNCKDKAATRRLLTEAGLPQPAYYVVGEPAGARDILDRLEYPVVVKPQAMGASIGVSLVASSDGLLDACERAAEDSQVGMLEYRGTVVIEEFVEGPEISIEGVTIDGAYTPLFVARKRTGMTPYFEELGHVVDAEDPLMNDLVLIDTVARSHQLIGFAYGITHTEVIFSDRGPVVVEINGRLGGDLVPHLAQLAGVLEPALVAAAAALGADPTPYIHDSRGSAAIAFRYPDRAGYLTAVHPPPASKAVAWAQVSPIGSHVALPPEAFATRVGYAIATATTPSVAETTARSFVEQIHLETGTGARG